MRHLGPQQGLPIMRHITDTFNFPLHHIIFTAGHRGGGGGGKEEIDPQIISISNFLSAGVRSFNSAAPAVPDHDSLGAPPIWKLNLKRGGIRNEGIFILIYHSAETLLMWGPCEAARWIAFTLTISSSTNPPTPLRPFRLLLCILKTVPGEASATRIWQLEALQNVDKWTKSHLRDFMNPLQLGRSICSPPQRAAPVSPDYSRPVLPVPHGVRPHAPKGRRPAIYQYFRTAVLCFTSFIYSKQLWNNTFGKLFLHHNAIKKESPVYFIQL